MRVAFFLPTLGGGGAERVMLSLATGFAARGVDVDLVLVRAEGPYLEDVPQNVRVVDLGSPKVVLSVAALVRYLRRNRPRVIVSALTHANCVAALATRLAGRETRAVITTHCTPSSELKMFPTGLRQLERAILGVSCRLADGVVAVSNGVADDLARIIDLPRDRIDVIYNPVVTPELVGAVGESVSHPWFAEGEPPVIIGVGRLTAQKDFTTLLRAFAELRRARRARLMILGEGPERPHLERLAIELGVTDDVALPGFVPNPFGFIRRAALFALSSAFEGLPSVLIQALACGTPVVSTDCESGPREILQNGRLGSLVPVGDADALARAMARVLDRPPTTPPSEALSQFTEPTAVEAYMRALEVTAHA